MPVLQSEFMSAQLLWLIQPQPPVVEQMRSEQQLIEQLLLKQA
jgi:hypothetical protein